MLNIHSATELHPPPVLSIIAPKVPGGLCKILIHGNMENDLQGLSQAEPAGVMLSLQTDFKERHAPSSSLLPVLLLNVGVSPLTSVAILK